MPYYPMAVGSEHGGMYLLEEEVDKFRLSSKSYWDVPVNIDGTTVDVLMAHSTPRPSMRRQTSTDGGTTTKSGS